ncbi:hypothetical protein ADU37_CDS03930 [Thermococcus sp. 2319x1]|nr:hypothetical protein ADU37_CDS03930 [Thermococcus sp. 2319x1]
MVEFPRGENVKEFLRSLRSKTRKNFVTKTQKLVTLCPIITFSY